MRSSKACCLYSLAGVVAIDLGHHLRRRGEHFEPKALRFGRVEQAVGVDLSCEAALPL